jgi:hypothetical protein
MTRCILQHRVQQQQQVCLWADGVLEEGGGVGVGGGGME